MPACMSVCVHTYLLCVTFSVYAIVIVPGDVGVIIVVVVAIAVVIGFVLAIADVIVLATILSCNPKP